MSESSVSVSSPEEDIVISSSSSSRSGRVSTSSNEVGTSNPQLLRPLSSEPLRPSSSQPLQPLTSQRSPSLPAKNALGDVKDQAEDEANPRPWYTADEKSSKMSTEDLVELLREYPLPVGWYARLPGLQEPANYGTKYGTGIYKEQVRSGYKLPLHPFALCFFEHYHMAPSQLVPNGWRKLVGLIYLVQTSGYKPDTTDFMRVFFEICFVKGVANCPGWYYIHSRQRLLKGGPKSNKGWHSRYFFVDRSDKGKLPFDREWNPYCKDFENPGKPAPNNLTKHILSHIKLRGGLCIDEPLSEEQLEWAKIIPPKPIPAGLQIPSPPPAIPSMSSAETVPLEGQGEAKEKRPTVELPPAPKRTRVIPPERSPRILEQVSIDDDPIFRPRWTLRRDDLGMPDSQVSEQHLLHGILPRDKEVFQTQTHETFACSFAQAVYTRTARSDAVHHTWNVLSAFLLGEELIPETVSSVLPSLLHAVLCVSPAFSRRAFILPGGLLFTENANLDVGRRPQRNAVYFTDSSKLSISKVAALNRPRKHAKDSFFSCTMFSRLAEFFLRERLLTKGNLPRVSSSGTKLRLLLSVDRSSKCLSFGGLCGRGVGTVFD
ncbi:hypothetical protein RJ639_039180 [Escallonia herrerae]|uniref:Transposase (putative) gypsy type domain-containing protein n=1 Tax=Escallonia herrerae TaxID=1293975 RepID=A0AA88WM17_9ASTE|nr:hypothetical protein RJ639_039180 [Escallonia herrerae]